MSTKKDNPKSESAQKPIENPEIKSEPTAEEIAAAKLEASLPKYQSEVKADNKSELWRRAIADGKAMAAFAFSGSADAYRRGLVRLARNAKSDEKASALFDSLGVAYASNDHKYICRTFEGYGVKKAEGKSAAILDKSTLSGFGME